jgi:hypothetical protein
MAKTTNQRSEEMRKFLSVGIAAALSAGIASAQTAPPTTTIRGTIDSVTPTVIDLTARDGTRMTIALASHTVVTELVPAKLSDVKSGSYIGTAAIKEPNGQYRALELQVFPESARGRGLGTHPSNLTKNSTMTNGTVGAMTQTNGTVSNTSSNGDLVLSVNDGSGIKSVVVPSTVPVVTYAPGSLSDLQPGAHVILFARKDSNGKLITNRVSVGKNGLTPPM